MATHVTENSSIDVVVDSVDAIEAALVSDPLTEHLSPTWETITEKADELSDTGKKLAREARRARSRLNVCDSAWDTGIGGFGRAVVDASGGHRDQPPYTRFFAKAPPSKVQTLGVDREVEFGEACITELMRNPEEALAVTWIPKLTAITEALKSAAAARNVAVKALGPHQTAVVLFIDDVNRELDRLEGDLRKIFAGSQERVAAFLEATRRNRPSRSIDSEAAPTDTTA